MKIALGTGKIRAVDPLAFINQLGATRFARLRNRDLPRIGKLPHQTLDLGDNISALGDNDFATELQFHLFNEFRMDETRPTNRSSR